jgi:hypothetical protein
MAPLITHLVVGERVFAQLRQFDSDVVSVPDVLTHVPYALFQTMWRIVKPHVMDGRTAESYFEMIKCLGRTPSQVQTVRCEHKAYWDDAVTWIAELGGVEPYILNATQRSFEILPRLWSRLA